MDDLIGYKIYVMDIDNPFELAYVEYDISVRDKAIFLHDEYSYFGKGNCRGVILVAEKDENEYYLCCGVFSGGIMYFGVTRNNIVCVEKEKIKILKLGKEVIQFINEKKEKEKLVRLIENKKSKYFMDTYVPLEEKVQYDENITVYGKILYHGGILIDIFYNDNKIPYYEKKPITYQLLNKYGNKKYRYIDEENIKSIIYDISRKLYENFRKVKEEIYNDIERKLIL